MRNTRILLAGTGVVAIALTLTLVSCGGGGFAATGMQGSEVTAEQLAEG